MSDAKLDDEDGRLAVLKSFAILDTEPEEQYDKVTALVKLLLDVPIAAVSLVDADRQWFKSRDGLQAGESPRNMSFCSHAIRSSEVMTVQDATVDSRFSKNPLVLGPPHIRSYAGVPLRTAEGYNVGTLCAIDTMARTFTQGQLETLANFAAVVVEHMELRRIPHTDELTGALTAKVFSMRCEKAIARYRGLNKPASLAVMEVDCQPISSPQPDSVIRLVAQICMPLVRETDAFGRIDGDRFAILLNGTSADHALVAANRVRSQVEEMGGGLTASFGIAALQPVTQTYARWQELALAGLEQARLAGGNTCRTAP